MDKAINLKNLNDPTEVQQLVQHLKDLYRRVDIDTVVTTDPNGTLQGYKGQRVVYISGSNYYLKINIDGATTWKSLTLS